MFNRNKTVFEILLKRMAMKSLDRQEKLMALVTVQVEICTRRNVLIYYKASSIEMQDLAQCDRNIKSGNETYAALLIFKLL